MDGVTVVHGSAGQTHGPPTRPRLTRRGRTLGGRAPASGSGHERRWRPRSPAPGRARLGPPGRDRLVREPHRQAPALPEGGVVRGPVRDPVPLPRDAVAAGG